MWQLGALGDRPVGSLGVVAHKNVAVGVTGIAVGDKVMLSRQLVGSNLR